MKPLRVVEWDGDAVAWDAFVRSDSDSSFCHLSGWREVLGGVLGHECHNWAAVSADGTYEGVLPLVRVRSGIFGHYLLSMPFLNYGGPLGTAEAQAALTAEALRLAQDTRVGFLELRARSAAPHSPLRETHRKVTVVLDLPSDAETLWNNGIRGKLRSQIRRPQKEGMSVRFGVDQLDAFYRVFSRNMRDLGTPVLPERFFSTIARVFPDEADVGCVYHGEEPVAAGYGFLWNGEFEMTWASSLREHAAKAPNMLLYWSFIERSIRRGARAFNFGRCTPGSSTHRFKLQWGGRDVPLRWGQWSAKEVATTPNPEQPLFALATRVWSRLPLAVANRVGPRVSRWFP